MVLCSYGFVFFLIVCLTWFSRFALTHLQNRDAWAFWFLLLLFLLLLFFVSAFFAFGFCFWFLLFCFWFLVSRFGRSWLCLSFCSLLLLLCVGLLLAGWLFLGLVGRRVGWRSPSRLLSGLCAVCGRRLGLTC